jgi:hypothetical protein
MFAEHFQNQYTMKLRLWGPERDHANDTLSASAVAAPAIASAHARCARRRL